jgi:hypothetical protein
MSSIQALERQVAELRQLVRLKAGIPDVLQAIAYGQQTEAEAKESALSRVPEQWRSEVRVRVLSLPWLSGRWAGEYRTNAVHRTETIDRTDMTPAVIRRKRVAGGVYGEGPGVGEMPTPHPPVSPAGGARPRRGPAPTLSDSQIRPNDFQPQEESKA